MPGLVDSSNICQYNHDEVWEKIRERKRNVTKRQKEEKGRERSNHYVLKFFKINFAKTIIDRGRWQEGVRS